MADIPHRSNLLPLAIGAALAAVALAGCSQQPAQVTGDPDLAKPAPGECAIAQAALSAIHAAHDDAHWQAAAGVDGMSLRPRSQVVNAADVPGYTDEEEDDLRGKAAADWRWCPGMASFIAGLGWKPMSTEEETAELGLGRPGLSKAGDEAKVYETFLAPVGGSLKRSAGPWVMTLKHGPNGAWTVAATTPVAKH
ncbi:MAG TPA: hypothetical protein VGG29_09455 [Caulobacteraceae bacterium]|jgi:hypothetical protein